MDVVAQLLLTSIIWGPALLVLYWIIRLAVRHALEDAREAEQKARRWAAVHEAQRRAQAAWDGHTSE